MKPYKIRLHLHFHAYIPDSRSWYECLDLRNRPSKHVIIQNNCRKFSNSIVNQKEWRQEVRDIWISNDDMLIAIARDLKITQEGVER